MTSYALSGLVIVSEDVALTAYAAPPASPPSSVFGDDAHPRRVSLAVASQAVPTFDVAHTIAVDGRDVLAFGADDEAWFIVTDQLATFRIAREGCHVVCFPHSGCDRALLPQMFVDRVVPHLADAVGMMALHASAVTLPGLGTVGFLGDPGAGKSTLSAGLCPPCAFVADDCTVVELTEHTALAHPSYPFARLHGSAADALDAQRPIAGVPTRLAKWRAPRHGSGAAQPLRALYVVERGAPQIVALGLRDAIVELARHLYRIAPTDRTRLLTELDALEALVRRVPVRTLRYPRGFDTFDAVRTAIAADVERSIRRETP